MNSVNNDQTEHWKKNIILFLSSQTISLFGSALVQYAMMWHITLHTESGMMMTLFIICGFIPTFIFSAHEKASDQQSTSYLEDFKLGVTYIKSNPFLKQFFLFFGIFFILMAPAAFLTPLQVTRSFGDDVWRLTAVEIAWSIGMMVGGGIIAAWGGFPNKIHTMTFASLLMGICTFALGVVPVFWVYLFFMAIFGISMPIFNTPTTVLLQEKVDESYLGRIFGVFGMISTSMMPIGMLIFGPMADVIKVEWLLVGTGILIFILSIFLGMNKVLLDTGKPVVEEPAK